jgi:hypothetical protein
MRNSATSTTRRPDCVATHDGIPPEGICRTPMMGAAVAIPTPTDGPFRTTRSSLCVRPSTRRSSDISVCARTSTTSDAARRANWRPPAATGSARPCSPFCRCWIRSSGHWPADTAKAWLPRTGSSSTPLHEARTDPIDAVGKPFDPIVHEAAATIPSGSIAPGMVVREVRRGWQLGVELLRPSQVLVAAGREAAGSWR